MTEVDWDSFDQIVMLARHGAALSGREDPRRPLSDRGRSRVERVGRWLAALAPPVDEIRHSGKARARETAEILGGALERSDGIREVRGLLPGDDVEPTAGQLETGETSVLLAGHLPFMGRMASRLLTGDPGELSLRFVDAAVAVLGRTGDRFVLVAFLSPELL